MVECPCYNSKLTQSPLRVYFRTRDKTNHSISAHILVQRGDCLRISISISFSFQGRRRKNDRTIDNKKTPGIVYISIYHKDELRCSSALIGWFRISKKLARTIYLQVLRVNLISDHFLYINRNKPIFVWGRTHTKIIIHLSVDESSEYFTYRFAARLIFTTIHLYFAE